MAVTPPERHDALPNQSCPWWAMIGPGLATIMSLVLVTGVYRIDGIAPMQIELGLSSVGFLMQGVVAYLIAAAIAFPLGFSLGARFATAVILPAICAMLIGVLLIVFVGSTGMLVTGRVLSGLGAGAALGVTTALMRGLAQGRNIAIAVVAALGGLAALIAPLVNQVISEALTFRLAQLTAVPALVAALIASAASGIALFVMAQRPARPPQYDMAPPPPGPR